MRLVINIPCYNEEATLADVLNALPTALPGIDDIQVQVVDDGSRDRTAAIARGYGCSLILHPHNLGLGIAFRSGVEHALKAGVDLFVNIDADHQYPPHFIEGLIQPILHHQADIVIGDRRPWKVPHFSRAKRTLQWLGNRLVWIFIGMNPHDAVSGFRAYSAHALRSFRLTARYSHTLDTLVQAVNRGLKIATVPVDTNLPTRSSRLSPNLFLYIMWSLSNFFPALWIYQPFRTVILSLLFILIPALACLALSQYIPK